ncbi:NAD-dependent epimerase/dehydratase family protein [Opitutus sp. ER46]|uniref:NAD-dependent epimerase/dehydratase family protein n=1 Tax=Opitutus sp. ER46 TaxID=2161864 RepID=UPI000D31C4ED|nr:NAD-dependent epimerase/dehydratase family protein [Opitutus sp. ER46]PTX92601.1 nucleoside-diphosphate sugar epimerase [Opitutus sp. ER46]
MQHAFVTGAAGFIGSNLVDRLLAEGVRVTGWDNLSTGQERFLAGALQHPQFRLIRGDNLDLPALKTAMQGADFVFHLAANADIRDGWNHPEKDLQQNTIATFNVLEAMRANGVKRIGFSSTGSVYGEALVTPDRPTPETDAFPVQTSLYGASKLAGEGLLAAYAESGQIAEAYIFRFVSILGERYTHGHVFDFYQQLVEHPDHLRVLGNGTQRKSYLYVQDCINAILHVTRQGTARDAKHHTQIYNLGTPEFVQVNDSIRFICGALGLKPRLDYTGGDRGWIGDNPFIFLDTKKIQATGWKPKLTIEQGIIQTLRWLEANRWVYDARH